VIHCCLDNIHGADEERRPRRRLENLDIRQGGLTLTSYFEPMQPKRTPLCPRPHLTRSPEGERRRDSNSPASPCLGAVGHIGLRQPRGQLDGRPARIDEEVNPSRGLSCAHECSLGMEKVRRRLRPWPGRKRSALEGRKAATTFAPDRTSRAAMSRDARGHCGTRVDITPTRRSKPSHHLPSRSPQR
jgi:hypothetical protein